MCLFVDPHTTQKLFNEMNTKKSKTMKMWKILTVLRNKGKVTLVGPYFPTEYKPGVKYARIYYGVKEGKITRAKYSTKPRDIFTAIHVFTTKGTALRYIENTHKEDRQGGVLLPVYCHVNDLLGAEDEIKMAAFKKVTIRESDYKKVIQDQEKKWVVL